MWPVDKYGAPERVSDWLIDGYLRRRRWEWEQQAVAIVNALGAAMSEKPKQATGDPFRALRQLGVKVPEGV